MGNANSAHDGSSNSPNRRFGTRRKFIKTAGAAGTVAFLAGCSSGGNGDGDGGGDGGGGDGGDGGGGVTDQGGSPETKKLRFISNFGIYEGHARADQQMIEEFNAMDNNIEVTQDVVGFGDTISKVTQAAAGGNPYDIVEAGATNTFWALQGEGLFQPLTGVGEDLGGTNFFVDSFYNEHENGGEIWGLPRIQTGLLAWVHTDLYEQNGLSFPTGGDAMTWDQWLNAIDTLHDPNNGIHGDFTPLGDFYFNQMKPFCLARPSGITVTTPDHEPNFDTPEMANFVEFFKELYGYTAPGSDTVNEASTQQRLFYNKKVAHSWMSTFLLPGNIAANYPDLEGNVGVMPMPTENAGDDPVVRTTAAHFGLSKNTEHPDAAREFLRYIFDTDRLIDYMHGQPGATVATVKPILDEDEYRSRFLDTEVHDRFGESLIIPYNEITQEYGMAVINEHGPDNKSKETGQLLAELIWLKALQEVLLNDADPASALEQAQSRAESSLSG